MLALYPFDGWEHPSFVEIMAKVMKPHEASYLGFDIGISRHIQHVAGECRAACFFNQRRTKVKVQKLAYDKLVLKFATPILEFVKRKVNWFSGFDVHVNMCSLRGRLLAHKPSAIWMWLETAVGAWATSHRMHERIVRPCLCCGVAVDSWMHHNTGEELSYVLA